MTTEKTESKELVDYESLLAGMAKKATEVERPSGGSIGTKAGVLTYNGTPCAGNKLDVIVVASVHANTFYIGKFDPNNISSPVCFAYSEDGENMVPHPASQSPQHTDCATCPMNQWKSDPEGGKGKACKNGRSLAVIPADTKPEDIITAEIALLRPPVTSVKNWQMYVQKCEALYSRPPLGLITQVGSVPDLKTQYKITFQDVAVVDKSMLKGLIDKVPAALETAMKVYEPNAEAQQGETGEKKDKKF